MSVCQGQFGHLAIFYSVESSDISNLCVVSKGTWFDSLVVLISNGDDNLQHLAISTVGMIKHHLSCVSCPHVISNSTVIGSQVESAALHGHSNRCQRFSFRGVELNRPQLIYIKGRNAAIVLHQSTGLSSITLNTSQRHTINNQGLCKIAISKVCTLAYWPVAVVVFEIKGNFLCTGTQYCQEHK